jgi:hypothetical protein
VWHSRPPRGCSGGILVGIKTDTMDVLACSDGDFHVKLHIRNKLITSHGVLWLSMVRPRRNLRLIFFVKFTPYSLGDFNFLRFPFEKTKGRFDDH